MNGPKITRTVKMMLLVGLCALGAILPQAKADAENQKILTMVISSFGRS